MKTENRELKLKNYFLLHTALLVYSCGGIFSKYAATERFLSFRYCLFYGGLMLTLFIYALIWQQVLKKVSLTTAFSNKGITIIWGLIIGKLVFSEEITPGKLTGALFIIFGIIIMVKADGK